MKKITWSMQMTEAQQERLRAAVERYFAALPLIDLMKKKKNRRKMKKKA